MAWNVFKKKSDAHAPVQVKPTLEKEQKSAKEQKKEDRRTFSVSSAAVFLRPLVTEKSLDFARRGVYVFHVRADATKIEIKKAFSHLYGVMPIGVRILNQKGKKVRFGRRTGKRSDWKKAFVTVPKGTTIDVA